MKKTRFFLMAAVAIFSFSLFWSCNNDSDGPNEQSISEYFAVDGASAVQDNYSTQGNTSRITDVSWNQTFLQGGVLPIRVTTSEPMSYFLVGMQDAFAYYNVAAATTATENENEYIIYLHLTQSVSLDRIVILLTEYTADNTGGLTRELPITNHGNTSGVLQVSMAWDQLNDVDLHLLQPDGQRIFYANSTSSNGGFLDVDSNAGCSIDNINNENITYNDEATIYNGEYIVYVDLWSNCSIEEITNYGVTVHYKGNVITPTSGENPGYGLFNVNDEIDDRNVEIMRFTITDGVDIPDSDERIMNHKPINLSPQKQQ